MTKKQSILSIKDLSVQYGEHDSYAINNVNLDVYSGEILAITGETGCGKSTLARACINMIKGTNTNVSSTILYQDKNEQQRLLEIANQESFHNIQGREIGMIFQEPTAHLNPTMKCGEQLMESVRNNDHYTGQDYYEVTRHELALLGFDDIDRIIESYPLQLSGGECQRVMVAMMALLRPKILIADEPTASIDTINKGTLLEYFIHLRNNYGMSILLITHDLDIGLAIADRIAIMHEGSIVEIDQTQKLKDKAAHPYSQYLLSNWNKLNEQGLNERTNAKVSSHILAINSLSLDYAKSGFLSIIFNQKHSVLKNINLNIARGEIIGLLGMSGSGKTSLARCLAGVVRPSHGKITPNIPWENAPVQMVFQNPVHALSPKQKVGAGLIEIIAANKSKYESDKFKQEALSLLNRVNLEEGKYDSLPNELSGGEKQRVCIARALATKPELIIFDEATSSLDAPVKTEILELLLSLKDKLNLTYIFISHDFSVIKFVANRVVVMEDGQIIEDKPIADLIDHPEHIITQKLIKRPSYSFQRS